MELRIHQENDPKSWDHFVHSHPAGNLLQSWAWGEFNSQLGNKVWYFRVTDHQHQTVAQMLAIKQKLFLGKYLIYAPRDLLIKKAAPAHTQHQAMKLITDTVRSLATTETAILWRVDPSIPHTDITSLSLYRSLGFIPSTKSVQPEENLVLDISGKAPNLLANMKQKTRYNIGLTEKKGVAVKQSTHLDDIQVFLKLTRQTADRGGFKPHSPTYYRQQFAALLRHDTASLFIAYQNDTPLAAILVSYYGQTATYLHGASSRAHKDLMASHLAQWAAIKEAQRRGCVRYDMGGVSVDTHKPHWSGITRFKLGFGGKVVRYAPALDLPLQPTWFRLYHTINQLRG